MRGIYSRAGGTAAAMVMAVGSAAGVARADYVYDFDNASSFTTVGAGFDYNPSVPNFRYDYGTAAGNATHSAAYTATNGVGGSGAVQITEGFNYNSDGAGGNAYTVDLFPSPSPTNISNIAFDVRLDPSSAKDAFGGAGYFQVAVRNDGYSFTTTSYSDELGNPTYGAPTNGAYEHVSIPLTGSLTNVRALTLTLYDSSDRAINGNVVFDIDNLVLTVPGSTPEPATLGGIAVAGAALLRRRRTPAAG